MSTAPAAAAAPMPIVLAMLVPFVTGVDAKDFAERDLDRRFGNPRFFLKRQRPIGHLEQRAAHRPTVDAFNPDRLPERQCFEVIGQSCRIDALTRLPS